MKTSAVLVSSAGLVSGDSLVYRHVLQEVGFLSEGFAAVITTEWLLARVRPQVNLKREHSLDTDTVQMLLSL